MSALLHKLLDSRPAAWLMGLSNHHRHRFFVGLICLLIIYVFLCLLSYNANDPAWSYVYQQAYGSPNTINIGGMGGAWLADNLYHFFGLGAWAAILWLIHEAVCAAHGNHRLVLPLRLLSYLFLWLCLCGLLYSLSLPLGSDGMVFGGIVGYEVMNALIGLFGQVLTLLFLMTGMIMVGGLLIAHHFSKKHRKKQPVAKAKPSFDIPVSKTNPKQSTNPISQYDVLGSFMTQSGLSDELSQLTDDDWTALTEQPKNQTTINHATIERANIAHATINQTFIQHEADGVRPIQALKQVADGAVNQPKDEQAFAGVNFSALVHMADHHLNHSKNNNNSSAHNTHQPSHTAASTPPKQQSSSQNSSNSVDSSTIDAISSNQAEHPSFNRSTINPVIGGTQKTPLMANPAAQTENLGDDYHALDDLIDLPFADMANPTNAPAKPVEAPAAFDDSDENYHHNRNSSQSGITANHTANARPDIHDDKAYQSKSFAMQTAAYRQNLSPIPSLDLLDTKPNEQVGYSPEQLKQLAELLEIKLKEFNIAAQVMNVIQGPIVTSFEVQLAAGVKASKVTGISQDLARSLSMVSLRVVEVIAGKPYIGIEIPNKAKQIVKLIELLNDSSYHDPNNQIAIAMGKDIGGKVVIADLAKAPHMLVAGTTGSGKSVLVNSLLLSMLLKYTPDELRLILIDPKMLELANYSDIPHLLTPVVTDMTEATSALSWCVGEMERRYQLMALLKVRKISEFNKKVNEAAARGEPLFDPLWRMHDSASQDKPPKLKPLPLIVVVADEFADMIMQIGKQAEELITRLAQKSRAAGIHLVLATQRPSVDVITGLIKANIPSRAALRVNSKVDSRTILDTGGAEDMLGHGDMLFLAPGKNEPIRVHGAYVTDEEVNRVTDAWRERGAPDYIDTVISSTEYFDTPKNNDQLDVLYDEALAFVLDSGKTSISAVQRKLSIGYNRAANIIESMQTQGVLSAPDNSGKRTLLL